MIGTKDVNTPITLTVLPEMECKVACCINRSPVASAQYIAVPETFVRKIKVHHQPIVLGLGKSFNSCKNILHVTIPEESGLANEPIVMNVHRSKSLFDTFGTNIH